MEDQFESESTQKQNKYKGVPAGYSQEKPPVIGITMGDINGIGPEVIIKALSDERMLKYFTPVIYGSTKVLSYYRKLLHNESFNYQAVKNPERAIAGKINVINCWEGVYEINPGKVTEQGGETAFLALEQAVNAIKNNELDALVTAPINKKNIQRENFDFPGHTEFLTQAFNVKQSLMMMTSDALRVGVVTGHIPLRRVKEKITKDLVREKIQIMLNALQKDFGKSKPTIGVLGLNPHAGEEGLLGNEELEIIQPVIQEFKENGHQIYGTFPADGYFGTTSFQKFDATMAMYHDQGLVPFKTLAFESGVNYTAGLPFVRTSPDHGTAYAIAGKNKANPTSMLESINAARDILRNRWESKELAM